MEIRKIEITIKDLVNGYVGTVIEKRIIYEKYRSTSRRLYFRKLA